jgi:WD40 repeat protein
MTAGYEAWEAGSGTDISSMAFSPDGKWMAGADFFGHAWIWPMDSGEPVKRNIMLPPANPLSFSADGRRLAAVNDGSVRIVRMDSGAVETSFAVESNIGDVKWHPTRPLLAIARREQASKCTTWTGGFSTRWSRELSNCPSVPAAKYCLL